MLKNLKISIQITATDNNVYPCSMIWYRLVNYQYLPITPLDYVSHDFNTTPTLNLELKYDNETLTSCSGDMIEIYIIPCCSFVGIISNIDCDACNMTKLQLPPIIPSTAYHNYIPVDYGQINNAITTNVHYYLYKIENAQIHGTITMSGYSGCILGQDSSCIEVIINQSVNVGNGAVNIPLYVWGRDITFSVSSGTPSIIQLPPLDSNNCLFVPHNYLLKNNTNNSLDYYYQKINGNVIVTSLSANNNIIIQALQNTIYVNAPNANYTLTDLGAIIT